jgi:hypothetical protein
MLLILGGYNANEIIFISKDSRNNLMTIMQLGARGSVIDWATMLQAGRSRVRFPMRSLDFSINLILTAVL